MAGAAGKLVSCDIREQAVTSTRNRPERAECWWSRSLRCLWVLMIAAGLLLRSFWELFKVQLGFNPQHVMAVRLWLPVPNDPKTDIYGSPAQEAPFLRELLRRGRSLPGGKEVALGSAAAVPLNHNRN